MRLQKTTLGGGYHIWHCEQSSKGTSCRVAAFMFYLNDVEDGGTEFMFQKHVEPAEQGKLLFFPADWTHTHRGEVSHTKTKYILTGWISLNSQP
jgi:hypothetical protein